MAVAAPPITPLTEGRSSSGAFSLLVTLAGIVAFVFFVVAALPYFNLSANGFGPRPELYWNRRYAVLTHIVAGTVPLLLGPVVLWLGETRRRLEGLGVGTAVERASAAAWFCWAVPLLLTEPVLQWRKAARV